MNPDAATAAAPASGAIRPIAIALHRTPDLGPRSPLSESEASHA